MNISGAHYSSYVQNNGGRVLLLLLLFLLAIYELVSMGFGAFAVVCCIPILVLVVLAGFRYKMLSFWALIIVNFFIMWHGRPSLPIPNSVPNELLQIVLLALAAIDTKNTKYERCGNVMFLALIVWCLFCTLEVLNDTCGIGIDVGAWYTTARSIAYQMMYIFLVFTIYISNPKILTKYLYVWGALSLFAAFWVWKQKNIGFTELENRWLMSRGRQTHILQGGTLIRYFSFYSDAANFGIGIASTAVAFLVFGITSKIRKHKIFGNQQIRRMRSAFDKEDASANQRSINQAAMKKYLAEAPWGIGMAVGYRNVPANNKYTFMATVAPDSEYVFIWIHTGVIGITTFLICTVIMILGACWIVLFRLRSPSLRGIGAGLVCAMVSQQLGGYGNQVLMQFPNCLIFYGGLTIVYVLPYLEEEWMAYEGKLLAEQEEKKRLKLEKKNAERV